MKLFKIIAVVLCVTMIITIPNAVFAYDEYCPESDNGQHDFSYSGHMGKHPHKGSVTCYCGEKVRSKSLYVDDCEQCRRELCEKGLHYYAVNIYNTDEKGYSSVGVCYCGKQKEFNYRFGNNHYEPYPGIVLEFGRYYHEIKHPHYEYNSNGQRIVKNNGQYQTSPIDGCEICEYLEMYYKEVERYQMSLIAVSNETNTDDLCSIGIHYYLANIHYDDMFSGYGECYCGKRKHFTSYNNGKNLYEPYPGIISIVRDNWEIFIEANHPHREYDTQSGTLYYTQEFEGNIGNCGICELFNEYKRQIAEYQAGHYDTNSYNNYYNEEDNNYYEDDYGYESNNNYNDYSNDNFDDYYNNDDNYDDYDEDDEFYDWLEIAQNILNS